MTTTVLLRRLQMRPSSSSVLRLNQETQKLRWRGLVSAQGENNGVYILYCSVLNAVTTVMYSMYIFCHLWLIRNSEKPRRLFTSHYVKLIGNKATLRGPATKISFWICTVNQLRVPDCIILFSVAFLQATILFHSTILMSSMQFANAKRNLTLHFLLTDSHPRYFAGLLKELAGNSILTSELFMTFKSIVTVGELITL